MIGESKIPLAAPRGCGILHAIPYRTSPENAVLITYPLTLVEETIDAGFLRVAPDRLIGDKAYESDALDQRLWNERQIELIAPHRSNRKHKT